MRTLIFGMMLFSLCFFGMASQYGGYQPATQAMRLSGAWIATEATLLGRSKVPTCKGGKVCHSWKFVAEKYEAKWCNGNIKSGTFQIDTDKLPYHLDLNYTDGQLAITHKCIWKISDGELVLGMNIPYKPGPPSVELKNSLKVLANRPTSFVAEENECLLIIKLRPLESNIKPCSPSADEDMQMSD